MALPLSRDLWLQSWLLSVQGKLRLEVTGDDVVGIGQK